MSRLTLAHLLKSNNPKHNLPRKSASNLSGLRKPLRQRKKKQKPSKNCATCLICRISSARYAMQNFVPPRSQAATVTVSMADWRWWSRCTPVGFVELARTQP
jgi:hypothetical protein